MMKPINVNDFAQSAHLTKMNQTKVSNINHEKYSQ
ncbi:hypothetical protein GME_18138 [Halomonas sp. TD01]|nr:hypothetical protein GME_18138 [Halomonas sp. TD01]